MLSNNTPQKSISRRRVTRGPPLLKPLKRGKPFSGGKRVLPRTPFLKPTGETLFRRKKGSPPDPLPKTAEFDLPASCRSLFGAKNETSAAPCGNRRCFGVVGILDKTRNQMLSLRMVSIMFCLLNFAIENFIIAKRSSSTTSMHISIGIHGTRK